MMYTFSILICKGQKMNYIEANLLKDERVIASIKHSWVGMVKIIISTLLCIIIGILIFNLPQIFNSSFNNPKGNYSSSGNSISAIFFIIGALLFLIGLWILFKGINEIRCAQLVVTNKRLLGRRGFIRKRTTDILLNKVDSINAENGLLGAIFHYGTIEIFSPGAKMFSGRMRYSFISNTIEFRKAVLYTIEKVKREEQIAQANTISQAIKMKDE